LPFFSATSNEFKNSISDGPRVSLFLFTRFFCLNRVGLILAAEVCRLDTSLFSYDSHGKRLT
jgi:hypothetical protein